MSNIASFRRRRFSFALATLILGMGPLVHAQGNEVRDQIFQMTISGEGSDGQREAAKRQAVEAVLRGLPSHGAFRGALLYPLSVRLKSFSPATKKWEAEIEVLAIGTGAGVNSTVAVRPVVFDGTVRVAQAEDPSGLRGRALAEILEPYSRGDSGLRFRSLWQLRPEVGKMFVGLSEATRSYLRSHPLAQPRLSLEIIHADGTTTAYPVMTRAGESTDVLQPGLFDMMSQNYRAARRLWRDSVPASPCAHFMRR